MSKKSFYCKIHTCTDFCIDEYNEATKELNDLGFSLEKQIEILHPDPCLKQCNDCINEMLDNRSKTQKLVDKLKNKNV